MTEGQTGLMRRRVCVATKSRAVRFSSLRPESVAAALSPDFLCDTALGGFNRGLKGTKPPDRYQSVGREL